MRPRRQRVKPPQPPFAAAHALVAIYHDRLVTLAALIQRNVLDHWHTDPLARGGRRSDANSFDKDLQRTKKEIKATLTDARLGPQIDVVASRIDKKNGVEMRRLIPVSIYKEVGGQNAIEAFRRANLDKIRSLFDSQIDELRDMLDEASLSGLRVEDLADQIEERLGATESKAQLLARDQTLSLNAELSRARQTQSGITHFMWSTSGDERVRESHAELDGEIFAWDDLPTVDDESDVMPGDPPQCRCVSVPQIPEDDEESDDESESE